MNRKSFLKTSGLLLAGAMSGNLHAKEEAWPLTTAHAIPAQTAYPLMDLHVHRSKDLSIDDIVALSQKLNMQIGVIENIAPWGIRTDEALKSYIDAIRPYPVFVGLQPMSPGWSKRLSPDLIAQADYIIMDPQIVEHGNRYGETIQVWEYNCYIDDADYFMEQNMKHYLRILTGDEPLDVFACPLFLPCCLQREYERLWTKQRLMQLIEAAEARHIAFEINDTVHVPHEDFVRMAKQAGLKFTFGSDARNHHVGRLDYCKRIAAQCGLTEKDFFVPVRKGF